MTGAQEFITPLTLQTLSRNPKCREACEARLEADTSISRIADLLIIAPATANIIAELALGLAGNAICEIALATLAPVLIAPAMNGKMWQHAATRHNVELLTTRGVEFIGPEAGLLACGYEGLGRLWSVDDIVERAAQIITAQS
jgi:phosphopantothenoylcysteine decarboxylase/phosphopantothenoylcysteine decarboxylase/phosphopantothenate--cysteine ligase